jgi:hypothetical protein
MGPDEVSQIHESPAASSGSAGCRVHYFCAKEGEDFGGSDDVHNAVLNAAAL